MVVSLIVAASQNGVIGRQGELPWRLPGDLARFKQLTMGHTIIMGRKTYESIGRPLPGRQNIVITLDTGYKADGVIIAGSLGEALKAAGDSDEAFIIGGESVFQEGLKLAGKVYLTRVLADVPGDRYFHFDTAGWRLAGKERRQAGVKDQYDYEFQEWRRDD